MGRTQQAAAVCILVSLISLGQVLSKPTPFYQASFNLDSVRGHHIAKLIPHINDPMMLVGITAINSTTLFGLTLQKKITKLDSNNDEISVKANFTNLKLNETVAITISVLVFEVIRLIETITVNVTSTYVQLTDLYGISIQRSGYVVFTEGFQYSTNNFATSLHSVPAEVEKYQYVVKSGNTVGWVLVTFVVLEASIAQVCSSISKTIIQNKRLTPLEAFNKLNLSGNGPYLTGMYRTNGTIIDFNFSDAAKPSHDNGTISLSVLQLDLDCIHDKFPITKVKVVVPKQSNYQKYKVLMIVAGVVMFLLAIALVAYCVWTHKKKRRAEVRIDPLPKGTIQASDEILRGHCAVCMQNPSNIVLTPCDHNSFCRQCIVKLKEQQANTMRCPICSELVTEVHSY